MSKLKKNKETKKNEKNKNKKSKKKRFNFCFFNDFLNRKTDPDNMEPNFERKKSCQNIDRIFFWGRILEFQKILIAGDFMELLDISY